MKNESLISTRSVHTQRSLMRWIHDCFASVVRRCLFVFCFCPLHAAYADCTPDILPELPDGVVLSDSERFGIARVLPAYIDMASIYNKFLHYSNEAIYLSAPRLANESAGLTQVKYAPVAFLKLGYHVDLEDSLDAKSISSSWSEDKFKGERIVRVGLGLDDIVATADAKTDNDGCLRLSTPVFVWWMNESNTAPSLRVLAAIPNSRKFRATPGVEYNDQQLTHMIARDAYQQVFTATVETAAIVMNTDQESNAQLASMLDGFDSKHAIVSYSHCAFDSDAAYENVESIASLAEQQLQQRFDIPLEAIWFQGCLAVDQDVTIRPGEVRVSLRALVDKN